MGKDSGISCNHPRTKSTLRGDECAECLRQKAARSSTNTGNTMKNVNIDLSRAMLVIGIILCIILFAGEPDLMDAILYKLTDGRIALPTPFPTP